MNYVAIKAGIPVRNQAVVILQATLLSSNSGGIHDVKWSAMAGLIDWGSLLYVNWTTLNRPTSEAFGRPIDREDQEDECQERELKPVKGECR